jgi:hypothetical protein
MMAESDPTFEEVTHDCARSVFVIVGVAIAYGPLRSAALAYSNAGAAGGFDPLVTWFGRDSAVKEQSFYRVTDDDGWLRLWEKHTGQPAKRGNFDQPFIPKINFDKCMVVAIFKGAKVNSNGVIVLSVTEDEKRMLFRFDESTFQTFGQDARGGAVDVTPFGIFVLPRSSKPLVLEENVQGLKDQPEKWKERARFD